MDKLQAVKESTDTIAAAAQKVVDSLTKAATSSGPRPNEVFLLPMYSGTPNKTGYQALEVIRMRGTSAGSDM